ELRRRKRRRERKGQRNISIRNLNCSWLDLFWAESEAPGIGGWSSDHPTFSEVTSLLPPCFSCLKPAIIFSSLSHLAYLCHASKPFWFHLNRDGGADICSSLDEKI
uniref:Uncharacterized protein n=1 Tax=Corvus moneduloides TaxID=1196302 RepID=A0A8U7M3Z8_CORMO